MKIMKCNLLMAQEMMCKLPPFLRDDAKMILERPVHLLLTRALSRKDDTIEPLSVLGSYFSACSIESDDVLEGSLDKSFSKICLSDGKQRSSCAIGSLFGLITVQQEALAQEFVRIMSKVPRTTYCNSLVQEIVKKAPQWHPCPNLVAQQYVEYFTSSYYGNIRSLTMLLIQRVTYDSDNGISATETLKKMSSESVELLPYITEILLSCLCPDPLPGDKSNTSGTADVAKAYGNQAELASNENNKWYRDWISYISDKKSGFFQIIITSLRNIIQGNHSMVLKVHGSLWAAACRRSFSLTDLYVDILKAFRCSGTDEDKIPFYIHLLCFKNDTITNYVETMLSIDSDKSKG